MKFSKVGSRDLNVPDLISTIVWLKVSVQCSSHCPTVQRFPPCTEQQSYRHVQFQVSRLLRLLASFFREIVSDKTQAACNDKEAKSQLSLVPPPPLTTPHPPTNSGENSGQNEGISAVFCLPFSEYRLFNPFFLLLYIQFLVAFFLLHPLPSPPPPADPKPTLPPTHPPTHLQTVMNVVSASLFFLCAGLSPRQTRMIRITSLYPALLKDLKKTTNLALIA